MPDIKKWITSGSYGFIFHAWIRLEEENTEKNKIDHDDSEDSKHFRRIIFNLLTQSGSGYEIFVDRHGKLVVGVLTKKEYLTTTVASPLLLDKR